MKKLSFAMLALLMAATSAQATSWKVGPSSVAGMDFASINAAMEAENVAAGDTLYLDQYYNESAEQTVTKKVVIIGTGYDTSLNDEQVVASLSNNLLLKASGTEVKSVKLSNVQLWTTDCTLNRCYTSSISVSAAITGINHLYSCYVTSYISGYGSNSYSSLDIQNCVITSHINYLTKSNINYNTIHTEENEYAIQYVDNTDISNNIILNHYVAGYYSSNYYDKCLSSDIYVAGSGNSIEHNIFSQSNFGNYPNNKFDNSSFSAFLKWSGSFSDYYQLVKETGDNVALGYATDGGEVGCHGGMFGNPAGGRPQYIPFFTKVQVASKPNDEGKLPVTVKLAIQSE